MKRAILPGLIDGIDLLSESLIIRIPSDRLLALLDEDACPPVVGPVRGEAGPVVTLTVPVRLKRAGRETRLIIDGADADARRDPDHSLSRVLAQAHHYRGMVMQGNGVNCD